MRLLSKRVSRLEGLSCAFLEDLSEDLEGLSGVLRRPMVEALRGRQGLPADATEDLVVLRQCFWG